MYWFEFKDERHGDGFEVFTSLKEATERRNKMIKFGLPCGKIIFHERNNVVVYGHDLMVI